MIDSPRIQGRPAGMRLPTLPSQAREAGVLRARSMSASGPRHDNSGDFLESFRKQYLNLTSDGTWPHAGFRHSSKHAPSGILGICSAAHALDHGKPAAHCHFASQAFGGATGTKWHSRGAMAIADAHPAAGRNAPPLHGNKAGLGFGRKCSRQPASPRRKGFLKFLDPKRN